MMVVSTPHGAKGDLSERVKAAGRDHGMVVETVEITPSSRASLAAAAAGRRATRRVHTARVDLVGPDHPGLVHHVTSLLRDHGLNISALDTRVFARADARRNIDPAVAKSRPLAERGANDIFTLSAVVTTHTLPKAHALNADVEKLKAHHLGKDGVLDIVWDDDETHNEALAPDAARHRKPLPRRPTVTKAVLRERPSDARSG